MRLASTAMPWLRISIAMRSRSSARPCGGQRDAMPPLARASARCSSAAGIASASHDVGNAPLLASSMPSRWSWACCASHTGSCSSPASSSASSDAALSRSQTKKPAVPRESMRPAATSRSYAVMTVLGLTPSCAASWRIDSSLTPAASCAPAIKPRSRASIWSVSGTAELRSIANTVLCGLRQRGEAREVDVAARDHDAHSLAAHIELRVQHRCRAEAAGRLGDDLHARREEAHRVDELGVARGDDPIDELLQHREGVLSERAALRRIGDCLRRGDANDLPLREAALRVVAGLGLDAEDRAARAQVARRRRAARQQSAAAYRRDEQVELADVFDQLLRERALAGHHMRMIERRNEGHTALGGEAAHDRIAVVAIAVVRHDVGAIAAR